MATVTGVTAERAQEIEDASIVSVALSLNKKELIFTTHGGEVTQFSVFNVDNYWPVGSIYISVEPTNPSTLLGGGTWVRHGRGQVLVGVDENIPDFELPGKTGGAKMVALNDVKYMPTHNHGGGTGGHSADHTHSGTTAGDGNHQHTVSVGTAASVASGGSGTVIDDSYHNEVTSVGGWHAHNFTTGGASSNHTHSISNQGSGEAHENMPPYTTCYIWKRTA